MKPHVVAAHFDIPGRLDGIVPFHMGHIHDSFVSSWLTDSGEKRYFHQRMNRNVFPDLEGLMRNILLVTDHLAAHPVGGEQTLRLVAARLGGLMVEDGDHGFWRTFEYVENAEVLNRCPSPVYAREAGRIFGSFVRRLADLDPTELAVTIPKFFHIPTRIGQLRAAAQKNPGQRLSRAAVEIGFVLDREESYSVIAHRLDQGRLPRRVVHYDPKINNILFHRHTGKAICVVDLDTCMSGTLLYDFGDMVRTSSVEMAEDEPDLSRVEINLSLFEGLVEGYVNAAGELLTPAEIALLPVAPAIATLTIGMRFLTDYLSGDVYFKTAHPEHNLQRSRAQFALVRSMETRRPQMESLVHNAVSTLAIPARETML